MRIKPSQDAIQQGDRQGEALFQRDCFRRRDYFPALAGLACRAVAAALETVSGCKCCRQQLTTEDDLDTADLDLDAARNDPDSVLAAKRM